MWISFPSFPYFLYYCILWSLSNRTSFLFRSRLYSEDFFFIFRLSSALPDIFPHNCGTFCSRTLCFVFFSFHSLSVKTVFAKRKNEEFFLHQSSFAWGSFFRATVELFSGQSYHLAIADSKREAFLGLVLLFLFFNLKFLHVCTVISMRAENNFRRCTIFT